MPIQIDVCQAFLITELTVCLPCDICVFVPVRGGQDTWIYVRKVDFSNSAREYII